MLAYNISEELIYQEICRFIALVIAAVIGAVLGTLLRPGVPEILIVALVLIGLFAALRSLSKKRAASTA